MKVAKNTAYMTRLRDLLTVIGFILLAVVASELFNLSFLPATLLFFGLPAAYLVFRKPYDFTKGFLGSLIGLIWSFSFDFVAEFNGAWAGCDGCGAPF